LHLHSPKAIVTCTGTTRILLLLLLLLLLQHHHHHHHHHYPGYSSRFSDLLCAGRCWFGIPAWQEIFLLRDAKIETEVHSGSNSIGTGSSFAGNKAGQSVKLTTHSQLVPWFRMSGDILLHLAYTCMASTRVLFLLSLLLITDDLHV